MQLTLVADVARLQNWLFDDRSPVHSIMTVLLIEILEGI